MHVQAVLTPLGQHLVAQQVGHDVVGLGAVEVLCHGHREVAREVVVRQGVPPARGLHSSTFQLDLSRFGPLLVSPYLIDWGKTMHQT